MVAWSIRSGRVIGITFSAFLEHFLNLFPKRVWISFNLVWLVWPKKSSMNLCSHNQSPVEIVAGRKFPFFLYVYIRGKTRIAFYWYTYSNTFAGFLFFHGFSASEKGIEIFMILLTFFPNYVSNICKVFPKLRNIVGSEEGLILWGFFRVFDLLFGLQLYIVRPLQSKTSPH